ncbi:MAG: BolA family transcriptional regulator [Deltaproteobacteria bacterium]|nr:BolA family transcriptional regulator [Deltaproteobacteria bacterium]
MARAKVGATVSAKVSSLESAEVSAAASRADTKELIRQRLGAALAPVWLAIEDESGRHRGHAGAGGGGHYRVHIVSPAFEGLSAVARQRLVYQALAEEMRSVIHALAMTTATPAEAARADTDKDI